MANFLKYFYFFGSTALAFCLLPGSSTAQTTDEIQKRFPNEYAVILNHSREMKIYYKDNIPVAESREENEILILDDKANGIYNKYKVYHGSFDELKNLDAYTRVPDGSRYKKIKVTDIKTQDARSSSVFYDDTKESVFDFPGLTKGALANVSYDEYHKDPHLLSPFYFASYMPVVNSKFTVTVPSSMELKYIIKNDENKRIQVKEDKRNRQITYEFTATDIKQHDYYGDALPASYYEPHVIIHIASYKNEQDEKVSYLGNVDDLYKWNSHFLLNVNTLVSPLLKNLTDSLTRGLTSEKDKAQKIYQWVQENIKYVAFENGVEGFRPREAADVCSKKYGDCKDMASLLTAMLKLAGLQAYFTWIGTRDIPYEYNDVPLPLTDNHMISTIKIGDEWIFLDGTDPNCIFGMPSKAIQGKQSMIALNEKEYKILKVPEQPSKNNYVVDSTFISISDNGIKGSSSVYYHGYFGNDAYNNLMYRDNKETKEYIKSRMSKGSNKFMLGDYSINKTEKNNRVLHIQAHFDVPDYGKKILNEYYINLNLEKFFSTEQIDTAKRKVPMDQDFKYAIRQYTIMDIPAGYSVNYIPEDYKFSNELFSFSISYTKKDNKVIATQELSSECITLEIKDFQKWNNTIKELNNQYKKQLVLQKK